MPVAEIVSAAVQADETTDVLHKSQLVLVSRYILPKNTVRKVLFKITEVEDRAALDLSAPSEVYGRQLKDMLIAQT